MSEYNIQAASQISGVTIFQLRIWEKRYRAVIHKRTRNNFREYSQEDIERLKLLGALTRSGFTISKIANLETAELQAHYDNLLRSEQALVNETEVKETKEKLEFLLSLFGTKKLEVIKYEISKIQALASVPEVLVPLIKRVLQGTAFRNSEAQELMYSLVSQVELISQRASRSSTIKSMIKENA